MIKIAHHEKQEKESLIAAIQGDKEEVLKEQSLRINEEIEERKTLDKESLDAIDREILEIRNEILKLKPRHINIVTAPEQRKEIHELEKEKVSLSKESRDEKRDCWKDIQELKEEERDVEKELSKLKRTRERYKEF